MTPNESTTPDPAAGQPATLRPEEAEAILNQDLANILRKVKEARPLTDRERDLIRQRVVEPPPSDGDEPDAEGESCAPNSPGLPKWAKTLVDLSGILGVDRRTLQNWKDRPGCPAARSNGQYLVNEWTAFARSIGSPTAAAAVGVAAPDDKRALEERKLRAECEEREFKFAVLQGQYTENTKIGEQIAALVQEAISVLRAKFERELPVQYIGEPGADGALNKAAIDEVCERLSQPLACQTQPEGGQPGE